MGELLGDEDGLLVALPTAPVGGVTTAALPNPFARMAIPPAASAKMITIRAVPRFTRPILPQALAVPAGYNGIPRRPAVRLRLLASRMRRSRRTSMGSYATASGRSMARFSNWWYRAAENPKRSRIARSFDIRNFQASR